MKRLIEIVLAIQAIGGAVFLGCIFVAPIPLTVKVMATVGFIFLGVSILFAVLNYFALFETYRMLKQHISIGTLKAQADGERLVDGPNSESFENRLTGGIRLRTTGRLGVLFIGMIAFWIFGGWVVTRFV